MSDTKAYALASEPHFVNMAIEKLQRAGIEEMRHRLLYPGRETEAGRRVNAWLAMEAAHQHAVRIERLRKMLERA